jgi:heme A synthase
MASWGSDEISIGQEYGAAVGLVVAIVAMTIIGRRTKDQPPGAYWGPVVLLVIVLGVAIGVMAFAATGLPASSASQVLRRTGFVAGFGFSANATIFVFMIIDSIRRLMRQVGRMRQKR